MRSFPIYSRSSPTRAVICTTCLLVHRYRTTQRARCCCPWPLWSLEKFDGPWWRGQDTHAGDHALARTPPRLRLLIRQSAICLLHRRWSYLILSAPTPLYFPVYSFLFYFAYSASSLPRFSHLHFFCFFFLSFTIVVFKIAFPFDFSFSFCLSSAWCAIFCVSFACCSCLCCCCYRFHFCYILILESARLSFISSRLLFTHHSLLSNVHPATPFLCCLAYPYPYITPIF